MGFRNAFTITVGLTLILLGLFGDYIPSLSITASTIFADPRAVIRMIIVLGGLMLVFPETVKPVRAFLMYFMKGLRETIRIYRDWRVEREVLEYLKRSKIANVVARRKLEAELRREGNVAH